MLCFHLICCQCWGIWRSPRICVPGNFIGASLLKLVVKQWSWAVCWRPYSSKLLGLGSPVFQLSKLLGYIQQCLGAWGGRSFLVLSGPCSAGCYSGPVVSKACAQPGEPPPSPHHVLILQHPNCLFADRAFPTECEHPVRACVSLVLNAGQCLAPRRWPEQRGLVAYPLAFSPLLLK